MDKTAILIEDGEVRVLLDGIKYELFCEIQAKDRTFQRFFIKEGGSDVIVKVDKEKAIVGLFSTDEKKLRQLFDYLETTISSKDGLICYESDSFPRFLNMAMQAGGHYPILQKEIDPKKRNSFSDILHQFRPTQRLSKSLQALIQEHTVPYKHGTQEDLHYFAVDSSVCKMEPSYFRMPEEAISIARKMLDPDCPEPYYILRPQFMKSIPGDKKCFLGIDYEAKERQIPDSDVLNEKDYITVFDPGDDLVAVISADDVLHKEEFAEIMEASGVDATEENFIKLWSVFPENIPSGASLKDLAIAAIQSTFAKEPLVFVFDEEIDVSDDFSSLEGYVWATNSLVDRLKAQEPLLEDDQFMENINFYPVYDLNSGNVSLEGHYYLEDSHYATGKAFSLPLTPDESNRLREAFEAYCLKREGKSCLSFLRDIKGEHKQECKPLEDLIQQAAVDSSKGKPLLSGHITKDSGLEHF